MTPPTDGVMTGRSDQSTASPPDPAPIEPAVVELAAAEPAAAAVHAGYGSALPTVRAPEEGDRPATAFGAHVTGVCSTPKLDFVRSLGADDVIDYTRHDFADGVHRFDLILDIAGNPSLARLRRALTPTGTAVITGGEQGGRWTGGIDRQLRALALTPLLRQRLTTFICTERARDLEKLTDLIEAGTFTPHPRPHLPARPRARGHAPPRDRVGARKGRHHHLTHRAPRAQWMQTRAGEVLLDRRSGGDDAGPDRPADSASATRRKRWTGNRDFPRCGYSPR